MAEVTRVRRPGRSDAAPAGQRHALGAAARARSVGRRRRRARHAGERVGGQVPPGALRRRLLLGAGLLAPGAGDALRPGRLPLARPGRSRPLRRAGRACCASSYEETPYALVGCSGYQTFWQMLFGLRGLEQSLIDLVVNQTLVHAILERVYEISATSRGASWRSPARIWRPCAPPTTSPRRHRC